MMTYEENRKRIIRNNLLMSLFFILIIIGVGGTVYYYMQSKKLTAVLELRNHDLQLAKDSLVKTTLFLDQALKELEKIRQSTTARNEDLVKIADSAISNNNLKILSPIVKTINTQKDSAAKYELTGYTLLKQKNFPAAKEAFDKSEKFYNGYHHAYEISFLLRKNKDKLNDPVVQRQVLTTIQKNYNWIGFLHKSDIE